jgi:anthranilate phosphoribosyltransferase
VFDRFQIMSEGISPMSLHPPDQPAPRREAAQRLAWLLPTVIAGSASDLVAATALANRSIDNGRAAAKLEALVKATNG